MSSATPLLTVTHVWDHKVQAHRDLHSELLRRPDTCSHLLVRELVEGGAPGSPNTSAFRTVAPSAQRDLAARVVGRLRRLVGADGYESFVDSELTRLRPSLLHAHFGTTGWRFSRLAARLRLPLVVSFYGVDVSQMVREPLWQRRYQTLFRRASRLVVLCEEARDRLVRIGCPEEKVRIWNHPLDLDEYEYRPRTPGETLRLITAARFVEKKGYPFLLEACARLIRAGRDVTLTAVGYGPGADQIRGLAGRLQLSDRFRLVDTSGVTHFDAFYNRILHEHDVFVLPSTTARSGDDEGGPALSLVLAQAAGLPVVCTPFPGSEVSVFEGTTGLFCRQDDAKSVAERIAYLADHTELWNRLGAAGSQAVRGLFDYPSLVEAMVGIYREAVASARSLEKAPA